MNPLLICPLLVYFLMFSHMNYAISSLLEVTRVDFKLFSQEWSDSKSRKEVIQLAILAILDSGSYALKIPITKTSLSLWISELIGLHKFLIGQIIKPKELLIRWNRAKGVDKGYKRDMVRYINTFGCKLEGEYDLPGQNPCHYSAPFLEALADYCEWKTGIKKDTATSRRDSLEIVEVGGRWGNTELPQYA